MNTIVDGRAIAQKIKENLRNEVLKVSSPIQLSIIVVGTNVVTDTFVAAKERFAEYIGVTFSKKEFSENTTTEEIIAYIESIKNSSQGIVVQLPLPNHVNTQKVLEAIPLEKDIDVLREDSFEMFLDDENDFVPPVAGAVIEILDTHSINVRDKNIAILGKGKLVGLPVRTVLENRGAIVTILDTKTDKVDYVRILKEADIVVSGAGVPNLIKPDMLSDGVVLIDAGTSSISGSVEGDIAKECAQVASLFSQTPGGVGPITVAVLFKNLLKAVEK